MENREIDFALERGLCSLLVGELDESCMWLGLDSDNSPYRNPPIYEFIVENSKDDADNDLPGLCTLLETWLMEVVFPRFRDTKDMQFKLRDYYDDPTFLRYLERHNGGGHLPLAAAAAIVRIGAEATTVIGHVQASTIQALQKVFLLGHKNEIVGNQENGVLNHSLPSVDSEETPEKPDGDNPAIIAAISGNNSFDEVPEEESITDKIKDTTVKIICAGVAVGLMTLVGLKFLRAKSGLLIQCKETDSAVASEIIHVGMA